MTDRFHVYADWTTRTGRRLALRERTTGTSNAPITLKLTDHNTMVCWTCLSISCAHSRWAKQYVEDHPEHEDVAS